MRKIIEFAKSRLFVIYLLSFLLVFFIPSITLGILIYQNAVINLQKEIETSNLNNLQQVNDLINRQMKALDQTATKISYDARLTPFFIRESNFQAREAIEELKKYRDHTLIAEEVLLYYRNGQSVYSTSGTYSLDILVNNIYRLDAEKADSFKNMLQQGNSKIIRPAEEIQVSLNETSRLLTYVYPISLDDSNIYGMVLFQVKEQTLSNLIENILGDFDGSVLILNPQNQIMVSRNKGLQINQNQFETIIGDESGEPIQEILFNQSKHSLIKVKSDQTLWSAVMIMPTDQFLNKVIEKRTFIFGVFLCLMVIGFCVVVLISLFHYKPIRQLSEHFYAFKPVIKRESAKGKNELRWISDALTSTMQNHSKLIDQVNIQQPYVRDQLAIRLLKGDFTSEKQLEKALELINFSLVLTNSSYFVMVVSMLHFPKLNAIEQEKLQKYLEYDKKKEGIRLGVEIVPNKSFAIIQQIQNDISSKEAQQKSANCILADLKELYGFKPSVFIGRVYNNLLQINHSYVEAAATQEYELHLSSGVCVFFEDMVQRKEDNTWYSTEEQIRFIQGLKQADRHVAVTALRSIMSQISKKERSLLLMKCMCSDLINTIYKAISVLGIGDYYQDIQNILMYKTLEEFEDKLINLSERICHDVERNRENSNVDLREEVLAFIHSNFRSYDFSLEKTSDHFGLSVPYLSRFIKENTGSTFTHYVGDLRMEEIKKELITSNDSIKDIIMRNGYIGISNFIEKFKRVERLTPSEYRKLHANHK